MLSLETTIINSIDTRFMAASRQLDTLKLGEKIATKKFKALVHFLVDECQDQPSRLGAVRLNKALWYTDVIAFKLNGESLTGEDYVKRAKGPVPKYILATIKELQGEGKLVVKEPEHRYDTRKYFAVEAFDNGSLTDEEQELARDVLSAVCGFSANAISDSTHDIIWDAARIGEEIPLFATLASCEGEISTDVLAWADEIISAAA